MKCDNCGKEEIVFSGNKGLLNLHWCADCIFIKGSHRGNEKLAEDMSTLRDAVAAVFADLMIMPKKTLIGG